ncbi:MAG: hypothetical protein QMC77_02205 [Methanocellales archaeon]|nr:hypothetical protein [Methanocellales archaeon]
MRKVKIKSMEDIEALPEGEWVEVPKGLHAKFYYEVSKKGDKLMITLPKGVSKKLKGELFAFFDDDKIVIEKA